MAENLNLDISKIKLKIDELENQGKTAMILIVDNEIKGIIAVADTLKKETAEAIEILKIIKLRYGCSREIMRKQRKR